MKLPTPQAGLLWGTGCLSPVVAALVGGKAESADRFADGDRHLLLEGMRT